uniref:Uncharacterized protein n=1 Tax=Cannabis sativa TaxID=3483 RepID=A0A803PK34_CANSA
MCLPKAQGGLGFRKSMEINQALLAKWGWALLNENQWLCGQVLSAKYLRGNSFFNFSCKNSNSWFLKNVVRYREILKKGAYYVSVLFSLPEVVIPQRWTPPPEDWIKINCDVKVGCGSMCGVALARNHTSSILWVTTNKLNFEDLLIGEAGTCQFAMEKVVLLKYFFVN